MQHILETIMSAESATDPAAELAAIGHLPVPKTYRGVVVRAEETSMFDGMASRDKDPRKSLHLQEVPTPELGPGEAIVAVMASAMMLKPMSRAAIAYPSAFAMRWRTSC